MAKAPNYTPEMVETIVNMYGELGNDGLDTIAEAVGRSVRSVRAKLVREGAYIAPVKPEKVVVDTGPTKAELLTYLNTITEGVLDLEGLEGATKAGLVSVINFAGGSVDAVPRAA